MAKAIMSATTAIDRFTCKAFPSWHQDVGGGLSPASAQTDTRGGGNSVATVGSLVQEAEHARISNQLKARNIAFAGGTGDHTCQGPGHFPGLPRDRHDAMGAHTEATRRYPLQWAGAMRALHRRRRDGFGARRLPLRSMAAPLLRGRGVNVAPPLHR
jgi:hypothetical protein